MNARVTHAQQIYGKHLFNAGVGVALAAITVTAAPSKIRALGISDDFEMRRACFAAVLIGASTFFAPHLRNRQ